MLPEIVLDNQGVPRSGPDPPLPGKADLHAHGWGSVDKMALLMTTPGWSLLDRMLGYLFTGQAGVDASVLLPTAAGDDIHLALAKPKDFLCGQNGFKSTPLIGKLNCNDRHNVVHITYRPPLKPHQQYEVAKKNGMSLVAFTDHESIEAGQQFIAAHPKQDCILGVELPIFVNTRKPGGNHFHINVLGLTPRQYAQLVRGWDGPDMGECLLLHPERLLEFLVDEDLFFVLNHLTYLQRPNEICLDDLMWIIRHPAVRFFELNAASGEAMAGYARKLVMQNRPQNLQTFFLAGSDSHFLHIGTSYVASPATDPAGFLDCLRRGEYTNHLRYWDSGDFAEEVVAIFRAVMRTALTSLHRQGLSCGLDIPWYSSRWVINRLICAFMRRMVTRRSYWQKMKWQALDAQMQDSPAGMNFWMTAPTPR